MIDIEIIFAEFCGKAVPDIGMVKNYFPNARVTTLDESNSPDVFDRGHPRYGWRMHDYYVLQGILSSKADIAISLDADMLIVSDKVGKIIDLTKKFGLCLPCNPRLTVRKDTLVGTDSDKILDESGGMGYSFNSAIIAATRHNQAAIDTLQKASDIMLSSPGRLPLALWRAVWWTGFFPCILPPQWCVCEGQEGCGDEVILHIGHEKVRQYYALSGAKATMGTGIHS